MEGVSLNLVESFSEAEAFMRWLSESRPILGVDTETEGFDWWKDKLRLVQFGDLNTGWAVPWGGWGGLAKDAIERYTGETVYHNFKFDCSFLEENGVNVGRHRVHDTRTMAHLMDPANSTALKNLGVRYVDASADAGQTALKKGMALNKWTWATVPVSFQPYWVYSALDPVLTAHLYQKFRPQIIGKLNDVYELEIACIMILRDIEKRGIRIDLEYSAEKKDELLDIAAQTRDWVTATYGFSAGSNARIAAQLQADGVTLTKRTDGGGWSMDESVLSGLEHPLARAVLNVRKAEKVANSYFGNYIDLADGDVLHSNINPLGARTGRMSISRPALQQMPRTQYLRDAFIPREGNRLVSVDFDQIEMRLLTHLSGDTGLIAAFEQGGDFFCNTGGQIYGEEITKDDPRRQLTKNTSYAKAYGSGDEKLSVTAGVPLVEIRQFVRMYDATFPGVRAFMKACEAEGRVHEAQDGVAYITTPMGRRLPAEKMYALTNYCIQGCAADIFKQTIVALDQAGLADSMVLPVHDEAVFDVPAADAEDFAAEVVKVFESQDGWRIPLTAGSDVLERWGSKYGGDHT